MPDNAGASVFNNNESTPSTELEYDIDIRFGEENSTSRTTA